MTDIHTEDWPTNVSSLERMVERHEPTIFPGLARSWLPAEAGEGVSVLNWLSRTIGHRIVPFNVGLPGDTGFMGTATMATGRPSGTTLSGHREFRDIAREMIREITDPTGHLIYVQSLQVDKFAPELKMFVQIPAEQLPHDGHWRAWIGTGNHYGYMHIDGMENLFCVLTGTKRFVLCPFRMLPDVYIGPLEGGAYHSPASIVDPLRPDLERFPRFAHILDESATVTLSEGDAMYLPSGWWHAVQSEGFNASVNYWWHDTDDRARLGAEALFMEALLSLRPLPKHWREFWKVMLDTFVFRMEGEPFDYLAPEHQGFAGAPTPERNMFIRSQIAQSILNKQGRDAGASS